MLIIKFSKHRSGFYVFMIIFCSVVSNNLSGCATLMGVSTCEKKTDPVDRYQCLDERLLPDVAKGVIIGGPTGALVGWGLQTAMSGHGAIVPIISGMTGAGIGATIAYDMHQQDMQKATLDMQKAAFDVMADSRNLSKLNGYARLALDDGIRRFKDQQITAQEFLKLVKQIEKSADKARTSCNGQMSIMDNMIKQNDEKVALLEEENEKCNENADKLRDSLNIVRQSFRFETINGSVYIYNR